MHEFAHYQRPGFLKDHPPILQRMILSSTGTEYACLAATVLGRDADGKLGPWTAASVDVEGVLAGDVTVPASGDVTAEVYVHASLAAQELIFADGVSAADEQAAVGLLRARGVYAN